MIDIVPFSKFFRCIIVFRIVVYEGKERACMKHLEELVRLEDGFDGIV